MRHYADSIWRLPLLLAVLTMILLGMTLIALTSGSVEVSPLQCIAILANRLGLSGSVGYSEIQQTVIEQIRLPRIVQAMVVGAALAVSGAALQGLFRNPLADPGLLGISAGAALAAVLVIVSGLSAWAALLPWIEFNLLTIAAFSGGLLATWLVYRIGRCGGRSEVATMLLAGIAINAIAGAATSLLTYLADDQQLRGLVFWTLGNLGNSGWDRLAVAVPLMLLGSLLITFYAKPLNALLLGEAEAGHLGFSLDNIRRGLIILIALTVGTAVALSGVIGFVGLVVPHLIRLAIGPDHRLLLPAAALIGAILLIAADLLSRSLVAPAELPIGVVTALLGGPFFLGLLLQWKRQHGG